MTTSDNTVLKFLSLGLLVPHTIIYTLMAAVARKPDAQGHVFFGPSAVALMELGKMMISILGVFHHTSTAAASGQSVANGSSSRGEYAAVPLRDQSASEVLFSQQDEEEASEETRMAAQAASNDEPAEKLPVFMGGGGAGGQGKLSFRERVRSTFSGAKEEILNPNGLRLIAPALLYVCQNNLQVFSAGCLTPAEYQIVGQTKLAFTAVFSVLILKRKLNWQHWSSIALLAMGTVIVQTISVQKVRSDAAAAATAPTTTDATSAATTAAAPTSTRTQFDLLIGTAAMLGASACSGLGGVLVEALLKKKMHFWTTNVHLAFFSLLPACIPIFVDSFVHSSFSPLRWFNWTVWCLIGFNILGGIIASMTMKYADNILKNFAVAISLIGTVYLSALVSGIPVTLAQFFGTALVVASIAGYARA